MDNRNAEIEIRRKNCHDLVEKAAGIAIHISDAYHDIRRHAARNDDADGVLENSLPCTRMLNWVSAALVQHERGHYPESYRCVMNALKFGRRSYELFKSVDEPDLMRETATLIGYLRLAATCGKEAK